MNQYALLSPHFSYLGCLLVFLSLAKCSNLVTTEIKIAKMKTDKGRITNVECKYNKDTHKMIK